MELRDVQLVLRPRQPWEAVDLGLVMFRRWWWPALRAGALPLLLVCGLALAAGWFLDLGETTWTYLAILTIWWCKPLYDRVILSVFSQAVFGAVPPFRATLGGLFQLGRTGLLRQLSIGRLAPARSFHLPVWQLEGLVGQARRSRFRALDPNTQGAAVSLTVLCLLLETVLYVGGIGGAYLFVPTPVIDTATESFDLFPESSSLITIALYVAAIAIIEPLYVACGFALYLNRRTILEGWDIELSFRLLAERLRQERDAAGGLPDAAERPDEGAAARTVSAVVGACLISGLLMLATPPPANAALEPVAPGLQDGARVGEVVEQVLEEPPFLVRETKRAWALKEGIDWFDWDWEWPWDWDFEIEPVGDVTPWVQFMNFLAVGFKVLVSVLLMAGLVWLAIYIYRWSQELGVFAPRADFIEKRALKTSAEALDDVLPEDPLAVARGLIRDGEVRGALSLLYQASVERLDEHGVGTPRGATEGEVLRAVRHAAPEAVAQTMVDLIQTWLRAAYADELPTGERLDELCAAWGQTFAAANETSAARAAGEAQA